MYIIRLACHITNLVVACCSSLEADWLEEGLKFIVKYFFLTFFLSPFLFSLFITSHILYFMRPLLLPCRSVAVSLFFLLFCVWFHLFHFFFGCCVSVFNASFLRFVVFDKLVTLLNYQRKAMCRSWNIPLSLDGLLNLNSMKTCSRYGVFVTVIGRSA